MHDAEPRANRTTGMSAGVSKMAVMRYSTPPCRYRCLLLSKNHKLVGQAEVEVIPLDSEEKVMKRLMKAKGQR